MLFDFPQKIKWSSIGYVSINTEFALLPVVVWNKDSQIIQIGWFCINRVQRYDCNQLQS